jgi:hypothetical protein
VTVYFYIRIFIVYMICVRPILWSLTLVNLGLLISLGEMNTLNFQHNLGNVYVAKRSCHGFWCAYYL